jgi:hypothetical protein
MVRDEDIRKLASSLKATGVAVSMMQAMEKAREILIGSEKTTDVMKRYVDEQNRNDDAKRTDQSMERVNTQITQINKEIVEEDEEISEEVKDINNINKNLHSNEDKILEEINKISGMISGSKISSLDMPPATGIFASGKSLNEIYSEQEHALADAPNPADEAPLDLPAESMKEVEEEQIITEVPAPDQEVEVKEEESERTILEEAPVENNTEGVVGEEQASNPSDLTESEPIDIEIPEPEAPNLNEIEENLNEELDKISTDSDVQASETEKNLPGEPSANMDAIIEDPFGQEMEDRVENDKAQAESQNNSESKDQEDPEQQ